MKKGECDISSGDALQEELELTRFI